MQISTTRELRVRQLNKKECPIRGHNLLEVGQWLLFLKQDIKLLKGYDEAILGSFQHAKYYLVF